ncbi:MAG: PKD domain-containing protein, partial [Alteromonas sp.]|nr:PKD domain-containing protein [Alteromonas sp.]
CPITISGGPFVGPDDATINQVGPFCPLDPVINLTAATAGGTWSGPGITNPATGAFDPGAANIGNNVITYTIAGFCGDVQTSTILINNLLDPTITAMPNECEDALPITFTAVDAGGTWSATCGTCIDATTGVFDPAIAGAGTHTITYTIPGPCGGSDTETMTVDPLDDATITPVGPFCPTDAAVQLTSVTAGGTWSGTGVNATGMFDPAAANIGINTITYTTAGPCPDTKTLDITITNSLDATITAVAPLCESNTAIILAAVDAGGTWSGNGITDGALGIFDPAVAGPGTHTVTYTIGGACGDVDTEDIQVIADDDATINPAGPFCATDPVFTMTAVDAGVWSIAGAPAGAINAATGDVDPAILGVGTWTVTNTVAGACGDTDTENVVIVNQLDATIAPAGPFCESDPAFALQVVDAGGTWSGNGVDATGNFNPATAGVGTHTITYTLGGNCGDVQTLDINVLPNADATVSPAGPFCIGNPAFQLTAVDAGGTWGGIGVGATGMFDPTAAGPGTHLVTYTINGQCGDVGTVLITVNDPLSVTALSDQTICDGQSASISAIAQGGDGNYTYTWDNGVGVGQFQNVSPTTTTTYTVTVTDGCGTTSASASVTITVNPIPSIDFVVDNASGCSPVTVTFTNNTTPTSTGCVWDFGDTYSSTNCGPVSHTYTTPGCYDVTLTATSGGCTNSATQTSMVCVFENAVANFSIAPTETNIFDPNFTFTNESSNADSYAWDFGDGSTSSDNVLIVDHTYPADPGVFNVCLIAETVNQCNDTICQPVTINDEFLIYVPNSFTPDGDGINDLFVPVINGLEPDSYELLIFDRWGQIVFESRSLTDNWNGKVNGFDEKTDVYVWKIRVASSVSGEEKTYHGHVSVLK